MNHNSINQEQTHFSDAEGLLYFDAIKLTLLLLFLITRDQTIWEILEFCYRHQILGLIYRIRADAHGILVFTC